MRNQAGKELHQRLKKRHTAGLARALAESGTVEKLLEVVVVVAVRAPIVRLEDL